MRHASETHSLTVLAKGGGGEAAAHQPDPRGHDGGARRPVAAIRRTALASKPESVGHDTFAVMFLKFRYRLGHEALCPVTALHRHCQVTK
jgi:hypothetical protein